MIADVVLPAAAPAGEGRAGGAASATTGIGELLLHLHAILLGTDRLMVQAPKTDRDLPMTTRRLQMQSKYVGISRGG
jgi:hypothetical protein